MVGRKKYEISGTSLFLMQAQLSFTFIVETHDGFARLRKLFISLAVIRLLLTHTDARARARARSGGQGAGSALALQWQAVGFGRAMKISNYR